MTEELGLTQMHRRDDAMDVSFARDRENGGFVVKRECSNECSGFFAIHFSGYAEAREYYLMQIGALYCDGWR